MRTIVKLFWVLACCFLLVSCFDYPDQCADSQKTSLPVDAYFNTTFTRNLIPEGQIDLKGTVAQLVQNGSGTDDEIGFFQIRLTCYWSLTECVAGRSGGSLTDGRGNTLNIICRECLTKSDLTASFPTDQTQITGRFEFAGGTGRFADATGEGTIECLVANDGQISVMSHHWQGFVKNVNPE